MYRVERRRIDTDLLFVKYAPRYAEEPDEIERAIAHARRAAHTNAEAMQYGSYVVVQGESNVVFRITARPKEIPETIFEEA